MKCPICNAATRVLETRVLKTEPYATRRRHECFNLHVFKTIERVDESDRRKSKPKSPK